MKLLPIPKKDVWTILMCETVNFECLIEKLCIIKCKQIKFFINWTVFTDVFKYLIINGFFFTLHLTFFHFAFF